MFSIIFKNKKPEYCYSGFVVPPETEYLILIIYG